MKNQLPIIAFLALLLSTLSGCEVIGGIFKAGVAVGVIIIVAVVGLIVFLLSRLGGKK